MGRITKKSLIGGVEYEDCYNLFLNSSGEYFGTIKVPMKSDITTRLLRAHKIVPRTKAMHYLADYYMEYQGTYPKVRN